MLVFGHRGSGTTRLGSGVAGAPRENTAASVVAAMQAGADGVEVDVRLSRDGLLVCSHDPDLRRVAGHPDVVRHTDAEDLRRLARPPDLLVDVLAATDQPVLVEVKNVPGEPDFDAPSERVARAVAALLARRSDGSRVVVVSSFDWHALDAVRELAPTVPTAFLTAPGVRLGAAVSHAAGHRLTEVHPHWSALVDPAAPAGLAAARAAGLRVVTWTVDDVEVARRLADEGVDGVITNDPAALMRGLAGR